MKKQLLLFAVLLITIPTLAKQKIRIEKVEADTSELVTYRTIANHWSFAVHAGLGYLDGDQSQPIGAIWPKSDGKFSFGANLEYTFNPRFGLFLEYSYNPYGGFVNARNYYATSPTEFFYVTPLDFNGKNQIISLNMSVNVLNMFYNCRKQTVNWYVNLGVGLSFFDVMAYEPGTKNLITDAYPVYLVDGKYKNEALTFPIGTTIEYTPVDFLSIMLNMQYRLHAHDGYDLAMKGNANDNSAYAALGLRWNIGGKKRMHVRNMSMCQYEPETSTIRMNALEKRVDDLEETIQEDLEPRIKALENAVDSLRDSDLDGVPDIIDREPNTVAGAYVNRNGETIQPDENKPKSDIEGLNNSFSAIYFATGKADLTEVSYQIIAQVARILYLNPEYKLEIHGFCDEQGISVGFDNLKLSKLRVERVLNALVNQYAVDPSRITLKEGHGAIQGPTKDFMPNRRVEFIINQ